jgi:hypothetical protein
VIDKYFGRTYHPRLYNCAHFVCDVWGDLYGPDMENALRAFLCAPSKRKAVLSDLRALRVLEQPEDPCVVLFRRPRLPTHVGLWLGGRVLHLHERGVHYQPLEVVRMGYKTVRFLTCKS